MPEPSFNNHTALEYEALFLADEKLKPILAPVVKATFDIGEDGQLAFAKEQVPVNLAGEFVDDPESSSYVYEPECAFIKNNTDVVVIGDAVSPAGPVKRLLVEILVGDLYKKIGVLGDRYWVKQAVGYAMSEPEPFETMPLIYENAFGGWDQRDETKSDYEPRNPVGKGFYSKGVESDGSLVLPNLEDPDNLIRSITDRPKPVGCGFTLPQWEPRAKLAGTYDEAWQKEACGRLPADFDRLFFNAASEGLMANGFLLGNEPVKITNMTASGELLFYLPGVRAPYVDIALSDTVKKLNLNLDTIIINVRDMQVQLIWRNYLPLPKSAHDVEAIDVRYG